MKLRQFQIFGKLYFSLRDNRVENVGEASLRRITESQLAKTLRRFNQRLVVTIKTLSKISNPKG